MDKNSLLPSEDVSRFLVNLFYDDYKMHIDLYDKIYIRTQIVLGFSGAALFMILKESDYPWLFHNISNYPFCWGNYYFWAILILCMISSVFVVGVTSFLLYSLRGNKFSAIKIQAFLKPKRYLKTSNGLNWYIMNELSKNVEFYREQNNSRLKKCNVSIIFLIISLMAFMLYRFLMGGIK